MKYYDYSRGLKAPYSMQVIKSPKGQVVWVFAQPVSLSYLLILFLGIVLTGLFWKEVPLPQILGINLNLLIMLLMPNKVARLPEQDSFVKPSRQSPRFVTFASRGTESKKAALFRRPRYLKYPQVGSVPDKLAMCCALHYLNVTARPITPSAVLKGNPPASRSYL